MLEDNTTPTDRSVTLAGKTLPVLALLPLYKSCNERLATTMAIARASGTRLGSLSESEGPCCDRVAEHETDLMVVMKHVDELGDQRFAERVERFESECAVDVDGSVSNAAQALWAGLLEALGYSQNKAAFRQLATVRPLAAIIQLESEARRRRESEEERLLNLEALLLGGAGLLPSQRQLRKTASRVAEQQVKFRTEPDWEIREQEDFLANRYIEDLERRWAWLERQPGANLAAGQPMKTKDWTFARLRPPNHPARRIAGLARLIVRWQLETEADLIDLLALPLAQPPTQALKILQEKLRVALDEAESDSSAFWTRRYDFGDRAIMADGKSPTGAVDLIGSDRAADMIVNIVLPFLAAYAHDRREPDLARQARETYQQHPKLGSNELIENMARQVFRHWLENPADAQPYLDTLGDKKRPATLTMARLVDGARRQQGLIYLHHNFCADQNFGTCPLGG